MLTRRSAQVRQFRVHASTRTVVATATIVLLISGQGFRYLLGLRAYAFVCVAIVLAVAACFPLSWRDLRVPRLPRVLAAYVAVAILGIAWSATRPITLLAVLVLIATTLIGLSIVNGMSEVRFMEAIYRGLQVSLFGGVTFELIVAFIVGHPILPLVGDLARLAPSSAGVSSLHWSEDALLHGGPIQGFVGNRNPTAAIALLAAIAALILWWEGRVSRIDAIATLITALGVMALTRSATVTVAALYVGVLALAALAIRVAPTRHKRHVSVAILVATVGGVLITMRFRWLVFGALGRSPEGTNRTTIWKAVIDAAERHPQGSGFVGYWPVWDQPYAGIIAKTKLFAPHAHNAFLDAWLQLGVLGLVLLVALLVQLCFRAWRLVEKSTRQSSYLPLGWALIAAALSLEALTESRLLVEGGWFLLVTLAISAQRATKSAGVAPAIETADAVDAPSEVPALVIAR